MHERSSRSAPSRLHQFCTSRQQLSPTTWHAGGQLSRRPFRWLAEEQSRLLNRRLRASAIGPDHLLASGTKDQAVGPLSRARRGTRSTIAFLRLDLAEKRDYPQSIFKLCSGVQLWRAISPGAALVKWSQAPIRPSYNSSPLPERIAPTCRIRSAPLSGHLR